MGKIFSFLRPYRVAAFVALSLMLTELMVELLQPVLILKIIDDGIVQEDLSAVTLWGAVLIGFTLLAFSAGIVNSFFASHVSQGMGFDIREQLYAKVQSFSLASFNRFPTSSLITRMTNDVTQIQNFAFMSLRIAMRAPLLVIGGLVMAFIVNARLASALAIAVPLLFLFLLWVMNRAGALFSQVQEKLDAVNSTMQENLAGMRLIRTFVRRVHENKRFMASSRALKEKTTSALRVTEATIPVILLLMNMSILSILWFGDGDVSIGRATAGEVVAIVNYVMRISGSLSALSWIIMTFSRASASAKRVVDVLQAEEDDVSPRCMERSSRVQKGKITFDSVSFRYPGTKRKVLHNISFEVEPGERLAVLGATGSGKSSLFQLIPRLYEIDEGMICIDDVDIRTMPPESLREQIGYVSQQALLFTGTVKKNIAWGKNDASLEEIVEAAKRAQIHDTILKLPQQYDTVLGQKGINLSGGQKQRLSIARALVRKPRILLLDDSTSALDVNTEAKLLEALKGYRCTTLMITQKLSTAMSADKMLLIDDGALLAVGSHEQLLKHSSLYQRLYQSQFGEEEIRHAQGIP